MFPERHGTSIALLLERVLSSQVGPTTAFVRMRLFIHYTAVSINIRNPSNHF